ncbi:MAG TPA: LptA/OstA family protein [Allocoleopsis sp.]
MMRKYQPLWAGIIIISTMLGAIAIPSPVLNAQGKQSKTTKKTPPQSQGKSMTVLADIQEANSKTGVITARGNVQIFYPARKIQATSAQAQYYTKEKRIVLTGNVYVLQEGNSIRGETVTYLIDEGRFIALPTSKRQVESTYIITDTNPQQ